MTLINNAKQWLFRIALKKAIKRIAFLLSSWLMALGITSITTNGQIINTGDVQQLTIILYGLWEILRNFLKQKFPDKFGWL